MSSINKTVRKLIIALVTVTFAFAFYVYKFPPKF